MKRDLADEEMLFKLNQIAFSSYEYSVVAREAISLIIEQQELIKNFKEKKGNE